MEADAGRHLRGRRRDRRGAGESAGEAGRQGQGGEVAPSRHPGGGELRRLPVSPSGARACVLRRVRLCESPLGLPVRGGAGALDHDTQALTGRHVSPPSWAHDVLRQASSLRSRFYVNVTLGLDRKIVDKPSRQMGSFS